jgi:hypothetical protein
MVMQARPLSELRPGCGLQPLLYTAAQILVSLSLEGAVGWTAASAVHYTLCSRCCLQSVIDPQNYVGV